jgi:predicted aspartyl protease
LAAPLALAWGGTALARQAPDPAAGAAAAPAPSLEELVTLDLAEDRELRMRAPVTVDGRGPFPFLIDTGADHSVLSQELALALGLPAAGFIRVQGVAGEQVRPSAAVRRLEVGGRHIDDAALALLPREHLGALGLVGLDALRRQCIAVDFTRRTMEVRRSRGFLDEPGSTVVRARPRFGQLILVDSTVRRKPVYVVLDTGAQDSVGNAALRSLIYQRRMAAGEADPRRSIELVSVTGQTITGEVDEMATLTLGALTLSHVPVVYAELNTFRLYGLANEPALMLGMGTLRIFSRLFIDFERREVAFTLANGRTTNA